jgi:hypothetical protein
VEPDFPGAPAWLTSPRLRTWLGACISRPTRHESGTGTREKRGRPSPRQTVWVFNMATFKASTLARARKFLKCNAKQVMRTINESVRTGSHIGLSKLRPT